MSRFTRSQAQLAAADENAAPKNALYRFSKRAASGSTANPVKSLASKGLQSRKSTRTALGDISNRVVKHGKDDQMPKKKRVVNLGKVAPKTKDPEPNSKNIDAALVEDVYMKGDSDTSLEDSVAELRLSPVDAADADDPQAVVEYINDIMNHLKETESIRAANPNYMTKQSDINAKMREILIDWLVEVHIKFKLRSETLYLTVNIIDRFLERRAVSRTKLQLVGCTAMLLASKYEEVFAPEIRSFVYISDKAYTRDQILAMESIMLNTLGFHLTVPTALRFGERYQKIARATPEAQYLCKFLTEITLQEYKFLKYLPSQVASAAVYMAKKMTTQGEVWTDELVQHTGYTESDLEKVLLDLHALAVKDPPKYRAVRKKYLNKKYMEVSRLPVPHPFE